MNSWLQLKGIMLTYLLIGVLAYLIGSIPFGYIIVRLSSGEDIRQRGSGNIGATNVARSTSSSLGLLTLILDVLKGFLAVVMAVLIARLFGTKSPEHLASFAALVAISGHMFPMWLKFHGGKGVATGVGAFLALAPKAVIVAIGIFVAVVIVFRYVSLASIVAAASFPVAAYIFGYGLSRLSNAAMVTASLLIILRHHGNIHRLTTHKEPRFSLRKAKKEPELDLLSTRESRP